MMEQRGGGGGRGKDDSDNDLPGLADVIEVWNS